MNIWVCIVLGIVFAIAYKGYQSYKQKKPAKKLEEKLNNNVVVEDNKEDK